MKRWWRLHEDPATNGMGWFLVVAALLLSIAFYSFAGYIANVDVGIAVYVDPTGEKYHKDNILVKKDRVPDYYIEGTTVKGLKHMYPVIVVSREVFVDKYKGKINERD